MQRIINLVGLACAGSFFLACGTTQVEVPKKETPATQIVAEQTASAHLVVIDEASGLMWQDDMTVTSVMKNWNDAVQHCQNLDLAGHNDWRLPSVDELLTITDDTRQNPAIKTMFQNVMPNYSWSATQDASNSSKAWGVNFLYGNSYIDTKTYSDYVRCVRDTKGVQAEASFESIYKETLSFMLESILPYPAKSEPKKGQFEKSVDFEKRLAAYKQAKALFQAEYDKAYQQHGVNIEKDAIQKALETYFGKPVIQEMQYDADEEVFSVTFTFEKNPTAHHRVAIEVPINVAEALYNERETLKSIAIFEVKGLHPKVAGLKIEYGAKVYDSRDKEVK